MTTFNYRSAKAVCQQLSLGISEVTYYGILDPPSLVFLRSRVVDYTNGMRAVVVRMDTALTAFNEMPTLSSVLYRMDSPTAAVVVHPEHYEMWWGYAHALAEIGVMRAIFLASQKDLAYRWAEAQGRATLSGSLR